MKIIPKKRRLERKTNYTKRKKLLEADKPRIVIRKSNKQIIIQYVVSEAAQDKVILNVNSQSLLKEGWPKEKQGSLKSLAASYLTGVMFAKKLEDKDTEAVLDTGLIRSTKGSRVYAALKGIVEGNVNIGHNEKMFPEDEKIETENVKAFYSKVKDKIGGSK